MKGRIRLENVRVAKPCPASWDTMSGNDQVRHCGSCDRKVFNLSNMTREEGEALLANAEGRICVRFYRRADGMVMTQDCGLPIRPTSRIPSAIGASLAALAIPLLFAGCEQIQGDAAVITVPRTPIEISDKITELKSHLKKAKSHQERENIKNMLSTMPLELEESKKYWKNRDPNAP